MPPGKPLAGIRVVGLTHVAAGPYALSLLGDFGADVINVESLQGDNMRLRDGAYPNSSAYFYGVNRSKRSICLNLKTPGGAEVMQRLLQRSDVFVHNMSLPAVEHLRLAYDDLKDRLPGLVYAEISAWGHDGPDRQRLGMDLLVQARSGIMGITGHRDRGSAKIPVPISDLSAAMLTALGVMLALFARQRDGRGQKVETSLLQSQLALMSNILPYAHATGRPDAPMGTSHPQIAPYRAYAAADGEVVIACLTQVFWERFCQVTGLADLLDDPRFRRPADRLKNRAALDDLVHGFTRGRSRREIIELLEPEGVPSGLVAKLPEVFSDPQVLANHMLPRIHQRLDDVDTPVSGIPIHLSRTPGEIARPAAGLGEHTQEILTELGYPGQDVRALYEAGAVG